MSSTNQFNVASLRKEISDLKGVIESKKQLITTLEKSNKKVTFDSLLNILDIYGALVISRDKISEMKPEEVTPEVLTNLLKELDDILSYMFPSKEEFIQNKELFTKVFGRSSVNLSPTPEEVSEAEKLNADVEQEIKNKKVETKVVKMPLTVKQGE